MCAKRRIIPVFVPHLGCPNDCVFCNQRRISGAQVPATSETVIKTVSEAIEKTGAFGAELAFYGGSFTAIPVHEQEALLGAAQPFIRSGAVTSIRLSTRPDCISTDVIERLIAYGVETVELGVQSMCDEVLLASNRGHTAKDAELAASMIKSAGLKLILQMMTGLPRDTPERSVSTAKRIAALGPDGVRIYPTVIIRDTALYDMWRAGEYEEHNVEAAASLCAEIAGIFDEAHIPIIRLGLNPTDDLSGGDAAGGAYHPAFGELVMSKRYLMRAEKLLDGTWGASRAVFGVARGQLSAAIGQHRANIGYLKEKYSLDCVVIRECDIERGDMVMLEIAKSGK